MTDYTGLHFDRMALLLVDMQSDFIDGAMTVPGTAELVPTVATVAGAFRRAGRPIVHAIRYYPPGGSDVDSVRRSLIESGASIAAPGTPGSLIPGVLTGGRAVDLDHAGLLRGELQDLGAGEVVLYKPRWSAFHRTRLHHWLTAAGVDSVVVAGCNLPNCPRATLFDASERDYRTGLVVDAVSGTTRERLDDLALIGVNLLTVDQVRTALAHGAGSGESADGAQGIRAARGIGRTSAMDRGPQHHLFSYGTLQQPGVQRTVFGQELTGMPDAIVGYRIAEITIIDPEVIATSGSASHKILIPDPAGHDISGTRFTVDEHQLNAADDYEVDDYARVSVTLRSGLTAWVYVAQRGRTI